MQYQHGGSRNRMAPFPRGGGGAFSRGHKQFYPPPPPPPPPPVPAVSRNKYEVLMEVGRLAAEYLVATGVLPPGSLTARAAPVAPAGAWGQLPPPPPLPAAQQAPVYHNPRNDRDRAADREHSNPSGRSRRSRGGDYSNSNSSNYSRRGKRKFGADSRYSDWGRDRERGRGDSQSYSEEDEDGAPGFQKARRGSAVVDEVGSNMSDVEGRRSKVEAMRESELEDTGLKVNSNNTIQQNAGATQAMEAESEANKLQEDKSPDSEVVVGESHSNNISSDVAQGRETEPKHSPVPSDGKDSQERHIDSSALPEKVEDCETLDDKAQDDLPSDANLPVMENSSHDDARSLLNYCSFARVPKRPRSVLPQRNSGPSEKEISVTEQVDLLTPEEVDAKDGAAIGNSSADIQVDRNADLVCQEHDSQSTACNQVAETVTLHEKETQVETEEMTEQSDKTQRCGDQENTERSEMPTPLAPCQNNLTWEVEKGIQIYNIDTPPLGEELIDSSDKGKTVVPELSSNIGAESVVAMEEQNLGQSSSFEIRDLNLIGSLDEIRNDPNLGQFSAVGCSVELQDKQQSSTELQDKQQSDFGVDNNANNMSSCALLSNKEVIDIEDDLLVADGANTSKVKTEMVYPSMENMMSTPMNTNILQGDQDGYSIAIPDYLGSDMSCYQPIQTDLQPGMSLNDSASVVMEDSIYGSLGDIGFMEVWDQPPQDYEKFF